MQRWEEAAETPVAELLSGRHGTEKETLCSEGNLIALIYLEMDEEQPRSSEYKESWFTVSPCGRIFTGINAWTCIS